MGRITFYYRKSDGDIESIKGSIRELTSQYEFSVIDICLDEEPEFAGFYNDITPALQVGPYRLKFPFDEKDISIALASYRDREQHSGQSEQERAKKQAELLQISPMEKFSFWMSNNYILFITAFLTVFMSIAFLAPVLMKTGHPTGGKIIYKTYLYVCHELAYRSYFLFGEQPFYPRELAHVEGYLTYERVTGQSAADTTFAREFYGNEVLGYKVAICERDIAIYGSLILAGLLFHFTGKKIRQLPWYLWILIAILPIGLDGSSQLFSLGGSWPGWFPIRESTPMLRTLTGALFGLGTAWYTFPLMEESMKETRAAIARKLAIKKRLIKIAKENEH